MARNIKDTVEQCLRGVPVLRDSDKKLLIAVWATQGLQLTDQQRQIFLDKCTTPETITRWRRKFADQYPPSREVDEARYKKFGEYRGGNFI